MIQLGKYNKLKVVKSLDFGVYLDGDEEFEEILLPKRYVPKGLRVGQDIEVFVYMDSEDRVIATTEQPKAVVGDFAFLKVVSVNDFGAFLDWGLPKDLLIPISEQNRKLKVGDSCVVKVFLHFETNRIAASQKLDKFLNNSPEGYREGEEVSLLILHKMELGYPAVINDTHLGLIFENDVFERLSEGDRKKGFIKEVREDGKINLALTRPGYEKVDGISKDILDQLKAEGGFLDLTDKTSSDVIHSRLKMSKKTFKKAIGTLYKQRLILIEENGIRLNTNDKS